MNGICTDELLKDIALDCAAPIVGGYAGRAVLVPMSLAPTIVLDSSNARKVKSITYNGTKKLVAVINNFADPFAGSNTAGNTDAGRAMFTKTASIRIPLRGADVSKGIVEAMANDPLGFILIMEKKDKTLDGGFEVIGLQVSAKPDVASITRTESENGGDITMNIVTTESAFENTFVGSGTTYAQALTDFDAMLADTINS